jgi:hypothetical protein
VVVHAALVINRYYADHMDTGGIIRRFQRRPEAKRIFSYTTESNHRDGTLLGRISQNGTHFESNTYDTQNTSQLPGYRRAILDALINDPVFVKISESRLTDALHQVFGPLEERLVEFYMAVAQENAKTRRE